MIFLPARGPEGLLARPPSVQAAAWRRQTVLRDSRAPWQRGGLGLMAASDEPLCLRVPRLRPRTVPPRVRRVPLVSLARQQTLLPGHPGSIWQGLCSPRGALLSVSCSLPGLDLSCQYCDLGATLHPPAVSCSPEVLGSRGQAKACLGLPAPQLALSIHPAALDVAAPLPHDPGPRRGPGGHGQLCHGSTACRPHVQPDHHLVLHASISSDAEWDSVLPARPEHSQALPRGSASLRVQGEGLWFLLRRSRAGRRLARAQVPGQ